MAEKEAVRAKAEEEAQAKRKIANAERKATKSLSGVQGDLEIVKYMTIIKKKNRTGKTTKRKENRLFYGYSN